MGVGGTSLLDGQWNGLSCGWSQCGQVIVLDHDHVMQTHAMVGASTAGHRIFFEKSPAWGGLACVQQLAGMLSHGIDKLPSQGGDPTETLQIIQGCALCGQDAGCRPFHLGDGRSTRQSHAILCCGLPQDLAIHLQEGFFHEAHATKHHVFAGHDLGTSHRPFRDD